MADDASGTAAGGMKRSLEDHDKPELLTLIRKFRNSHAQMKTELAEAKDRGQKAEEQATEFKKKLLDLIPKTKQFQVLSI